MHRITHCMSMLRALGAQRRVGYATVHAASHILAESVCCSLWERQQRVDYSRICGYFNAAVHWTPWQMSDLAVAPDLA